MAFIQSLSGYSIQFLVVGLIVVAAGTVLSKIRKRGAVYVIGSVVFFAGIAITLAGVLLALRWYGVF